MRPIARGRTIILAYHRVAKLDRDPQQLAVCPERFIEHLRVLRSMAEIVPLADVLSRSERRRVALTFDDGYGDNVREALPALEAMEAPATVFVTAGLVGTGREFWWDRLERAVRDAAPSSRWIQVTIGGARLRVDVATPAGRGRAYTALHRRLRPLRPDAIDEILCDVEEQLQVSTSPRLSDLPITIEELSGLARRGRLEIGAHTMNHPLLSTLSTVEQWTEIRTSRETLQRLTKTPVNHFAYPFGGRDAFGRTTMRLVARAGYRSACANWPGHVGQRPKRFALPRHLVRNWDAAEFSMRLHDWLVT